MTKPRRRDTPGSISLENVTVTDSAIALGSDARAVVNLDKRQFAVAEAELALLRAELTERSARAAGRPAGESPAVEVALEQVNSLDAELHTAQPRAVVVSDLLEKLSATLVSVTGVSESLIRMGRAVGAIFGVN